MQTNRRAFLAGAAGLATAGGVAGCLGGSAGDRAGSGSPDGPHVYAAFFTLADWTRQVAGDELDVVNPVPVGDIGHGWEPPADLGARLADAEAFVYPDLGEFRWAQDAAASMREEDVDIELVDVTEGMDLREWDADHGHEDGHDDHDHGDGGHDDHGEHEDESQDGGPVDPHIWVDPGRAREAVGTIADGLAAADPDGADAYADNAAAYDAELRELHETYEAELADRTHDVLVVAGHDSFQYMADRYGFETHSPQGVSPQDEPSQDEIVATIELVDDRGITHVAYDRFESDRLARTIVTDSNAEEAVAMSAAAGTTTEWNDRGWGYLDQMKEINLPALKAALGTDP